jgi:GxxExxY protein
MTKKYVEDLSRQVIGAAIEIHKEIGPGLLESVYQACMRHELHQRGIRCLSQQTIPIQYKGIHLDAELRYDLLVEQCIVVELKAAKEHHPVFEAQAMTYARLLGVPKAMIINFCSTNIFYQGLHTFVNDFYRQLPDS